jgi:hypothetical protein
MYNTEYFVDTNTSATTGNATGTGTGSASAGGEIPPELKCCNPLDTSKLVGLTKVPNIIKNNVNEGIEELIQTSKNKDESSFLVPQNTKYVDENIRKQYKHIDYLLEKIRLFDHDIYKVLVPSYTKQQFDDMKEEDNNLMTGPVPEPCPEAAS